MCVDKLFKCNYDGNLYFVNKKDPVGQDLLRNDWNSGVRYVTLIMCLSVI